MVTNVVRGYVRDPSTGAGINAVTVAAKKHDGGGTVASDNTDATGLFEIDHDTLGYPGPLYLQFTSGSTTDIHSGNVTGQVGGLIFAADIPDVIALLGIGVANGLAASSAGTDMNIDVTAGMALLKDGHPFVLEAADEVTIGAADGSNPRIDRVVLRLVREGQTAQGKITLEVVAGTAAASPAAPALTQSASTWEFSLAQVLVGTGVTSIAADKVTDERTYLNVPLLAGLTAAADKLPYFSSASAMALADLTTAGRALLDDANATAQRATLSAAPNSALYLTTGSHGELTNEVAINNLIAGVLKNTPGVGAGIAIATEGTDYWKPGGTDVAVADGGTGASTAADARTNLGLVAGGAGDVWVEKAGDTMTGDLTLGRHVKSSGTSPSIAASANLGSTGTASIIGTDTVGRITLTPGGTGIATGIQATITFANAFASSDYAVLLFAADDDAAAVAATVYVNDGGQATTAWAITKATSALSSGIQYIWKYLVVEYEP